MGAQLVIASVEVPSGVLAEDETATFDVEFEIDRRGRVVRSSMRETSRPDLQQSVLAQHRRWLYAVATREEPCNVSAYAGLQRIALTRRAGKLAMTQQPAHVERVVWRLHGAPRPDGSSSHTPIRISASPPPAYPPAALREGVRASIGVVIEFGIDGRPIDAYVTNMADDRWGFTEAVLKSALGYQSKTLTGRNELICRPFAFGIP